MVTVIKRILALIISFIVPITSSTSLAGKLGDYAGDFKAKNEENIRLNVSVISDIHMTNSPFRREILKLGLSDMQKSLSPIDALVMVGDNTDHGNRDQYESLKEAFKNYIPAKRVLMAVGNHDTWNNEEEGDNRFPESKELYLEYYEKLCKEKIDNVYHQTTVNGYHFIFLSSEKDNTGAYLSPAQLLWFEGAMEEASRDNLPIFVFCHWPINQTHGLPQTWGDKEYEPDTGGLGDQSDDVKNILTKYAESNDVFYITGHIHSGFTNDEDDALYGYNSVENYGRLHLINVPCYMYMTTRGRIMNGTGYQIEVYDDCVELRARNFATGVWYTLYDTSFSIG